MYSAFTGFYLVLPSFYWVLPSFTSFYWLLLSFTELLLGFTTVFYVLLGHEIPISVEISSMIMKSMMLNAIEILSRFIGKNQMEGLGPTARPCLVAMTIKGLRFHFNSLNEPFSALFSIFRQLRTLSHRLLLGFTGFYWVLPSFTGFYWVFTGLIEFVLGFT